MHELARDALQTLWDDGDFVLSRGRSEGDRSPLLVLAPAVDQPTPGSLQRLAHEYALRDALDPAWAARPLALVQHQGRPTLVRADPGGELLARLLGTPWEIAPFLRVAIGLAVALGRLHARGLLHKDVKPAHILAHAATGEAWLTGFGIASRLPRERPAPAPPDVIAGTLAYMAPEQTGRMNRSVDARSDLYAYGVTLYQMLTGVLPFTATEPMEWVHCHIARPPMPPEEWVQDLPGPITAMVMKLLAKTAEDRYQTAAGVAADLRRCLASWEAHGRIDPFPLGAHDVSDRLLLPEKLYGREREIDRLLAAFDRVVARGTPELVLVSGAAGIGKSAVVHELHRALVPPRGLFASGKFDQYKRDIPYATLAQAFQSLVRPLLGRTEAELGTWRDTLRQALGPNGQLIVHLIPELALVIGTQPPVPDLPPQDAQHRFQTVFRRFLSVFARPEHPLALFLDDLQWLDAATLDLLAARPHRARGAASVGRRRLPGQRSQSLAPADADACGHPHGRRARARHRAGAPHPRRCWPARRRHPALRAGPRPAPGPARAREDRWQPLLRPPVCHGAGRGGTPRVRPGGRGLDLGPGTHPGHGLHRQRRRSPGGYAASPRPPPRGMPCTCSPVWGTAPRPRRCSSCTGPPRRRSTRRCGRRCGPGSSAAWTVPTPSSTTVSRRRRMRSSPTASGP